MTTSRMVMLITMNRILMLVLKRGIREMVWCVWYFSFYSKCTHIRHVRFLINKLVPGTTPRSLFHLICLVFIFYFTLSKSEPQPFHAHSPIRTTTPPPSHTSVYPRSLSITALGTPGPRPSYDATTIATLPRPADLLRYVRFSQNRVQLAILPVTSACI